MEVTILKSTSKEVIVQVLSLTGDSADVNITWANLSELFDHPDAPGGITGGSVTGERQRGKDKLVCKTVSWTNNEDGANGPEMAITWVNGSLLYACPDDAGSHTLVVQACLLMHLLYMQLMLFYVHMLPLGHLMPMNICGLK